MLPCIFRMKDHYIRAKLKEVARRFNLKTVCQLQGAYRVQKVQFFAVLCRRVQDISALKSILAKVEVGGSNPLSRSIFPLGCG